MAGNSTQDLMTQMTQWMQSMRQMTGAPTVQQRDQALDAYMGAIRTAGGQREDPLTTVSDAIMGSLGEPTSAFASAGKALAERSKLERESALKSEVLATKAQYDDVTSRAQGAGTGLGQGALTSLMNAQLNPIMNIGGAGYNKMTGKLVVPPNMTSAYEKKWEANFKLAQERRADDPNSWATDQTNAEFAEIMRNPTVAGGAAQGTQQPAPMPQPQAPQPPAPQPSQTAPAPAPQIKNSETAAMMKKKMEEAAAAGDYTLALELQQALRTAAPPQPTASVKPAPLARPDLVQEKGEIAGTEDTYKSLVKERDQLNTAAAAANDMRGQFNLLRKLYTTENMPEGELGPLVQQIRSGLKSVGVEVSDATNAANVVEAITGKMALLTRTADGNNLMPGPMTNFEQVILRSLVPGLQATAEGRAALIDLMDHMAQSRARFAEEANKLAKGNKRNLLGPEWYQRRERIAKEEMVKLARLNQRIAEQLGAKQ